MFLTDFGCGDIFWFFFLFYPGISNIPFEISMAVQLPLAKHNGWFHLQFAECPLVRYFFG